MGGAVGVELGEMVGELSEEPLVGVLETANADHVCNISSWSRLMPSCLTPVTVFKKMAIRVDPSSRAVGIVLDCASQDGLQAALQQPERALG